MRRKPEKVCPEINATAERGKDTSGPRSHLLPHPSHRSSPESNNAKFSFHHFTPLLLVLPPWSTPKNPAPFLMVLPCSGVDGCLSLITKDGKGCSIGERDRLSALRPRTEVTGLGFNREMWVKH
ncbi:hypothetical protein KIL84_000437 [Mauremys mutica]|uniref:Uncharacterized protein n=1 Tax=Mauremys mutica TaxID=74926 RepID=A0A9D3XGB5_9SAUR|nr:hypothetical protein KIL84_000437 [Mauremys mutica]